MLKEAFIGRVPTHFNFNPLVKSFIVSEMILWSSYNLFTPILAVFVIEKIPGGTIEKAALGFSFYMVVRVVTEMVSGFLLSKKLAGKKFLVICIGLLVLSITYASFSLSTTLFQLYLSYGLLGVGLGISTPARMSLFSKHLDQNKEAFEWSLHDATSFVGMALAGALGGFVAQMYGFPLLFLIASVGNLMAVIPYLQFMKNELQPKNS